MTAFVKHVHDGAEVRAPYNEDFKEFLKQHIPWQFREWRPVEKAWWVSREYVSDLLDMCHHFFAHVEEVNGSTDYTGHAHRKKEPPPKRPSTKQYKGPHATLYLLPEAPKEVVKAAYRVLAKTLHPDLGGSNGEMQELNRAYKEITDT